MPNSREIVKIGLAVTDAGRLLVVRKRGGSRYILPGGKPEGSEDDIAALAREIDEELGCQLDASSLVFLGSFSDLAADMDDTVVTIKLYAAELVGNPTANSEIEVLKWFSMEDGDQTVLAPSLQNKIIPFLNRNGRLAGSLASRQS